MTSHGYVNLSGADPHWDARDFLAALEDDRLIVEQIASEIGTCDRANRTSATLKGLGLGKIGRISILNDTPAARGMVRSVSHLVVIKERNEIDRSAFDRLRQACRRTRRNPALGLQRKLRRFERLSQVDGIEAPLLAADILDVVGRRRYLMQGDSIRHGVAKVNRAMYEAIFGSDKSKARQAAYCLVAASNDFGKGLDPHATVASLKGDQVARFRDMR